MRTCSPTRTSTPTDRSALDTKDSSDDYRQARPRHELHRVLAGNSALAEVRRLGGDVFSTSAAEAGYLTDDPDDPSRKLIRQVLGAVAECERSMIALRLRSGRGRKAHDGGYAFGAPPFGFRVEDGGLVPDETEQQTLDRAQELQADGAFIREIATTLNEEGLRTKRGTRWHPTTVARCLG